MPPSHHTGQTTLPCPSHTACSRLHTLHFTSKLHRLATCCLQPVPRLQGPLQHVLAAGRTACCFTQTLPQMLFLQTIYSSLA